MSGKRKDNKGRLLMQGESQRKDSSYQYRFTDSTGTRKTVYAKSLTELRNKEKKLEFELMRSPNYAMGTISVLFLVRKYVALKTTVSYGTRLGYKAVLNHLEQEDFGNSAVKDVKKSDAKLWFLDMFNKGKKYYAIQNIRNVVKPAFDMAVEDDIIYRNPFDFKLNDVLERTSQRKVALTLEQQKDWMDFVKSSPIYCKHYDEFLILLHTGIRVSEMCGLTKNDLDFDNRRICIDHQLRRGPNSRYFITKPKTKSGVRYIPMDDEVHQSLLNILKNRKEPKIPMIIDGYSGFLFMTSRGRPKIANIIESAVENAWNRYNVLHPDSPLPHITPHVLRHTFCTNMANSGMTVKSLQYLMGHANSRVTLDVYTHESYENAEKEMATIVNISGFQNSEKSAQVDI